MAQTIKRVLGVALAWAFIYALPAVPLEGLPNLGVRLPGWAYEVDVWPQTLAIPGFIAGLFFAGLLAGLGQLRGFETRSAGRLIGLGAVAGLLVGGFLRLVLGPPQHESLVLLVIGVATVLGAIAGPLSALVFRFVASRRRVSAGAQA